LLLDLVPLSEVFNSFAITPFAELLWSLLDNIAPVSDAMCEVADGHSTDGSV